MAILSSAGMSYVFFFFFFSSRRRHTRCSRDWSSDVCSSDVSQPERDGVLARGGGQLVDELLAAELDLRSDRIAQVRASERRTGVEERRDHLPGQQLVVETVGFCGHAEVDARFGRQADRHAGEAVARIRFVRVDVPARERSEEHTSEIQSRLHLVCRLLLEKKK